jgi:pimeloyl-ACP methyl ester carboxylesterase
MSWIRYSGFLYLSLLIHLNVLASDDTTTIYLFPGQGSDYRIFKELDWKDSYDTVNMHFPVPKKNETLSEYALRFIPLIDTSSDFILLGVSLGGMICTELTDTLNPKRTILISSAKKSEELPGRYTFQKSIRLNRMIPKKTVKKGAIILQPIVEPDSKEDLVFFRSMLGSKDPTYLKRTVNMIINWQRTGYNPDIVHIHGDKDHTIPIKNVEADYVIENGSHMMVYTRAEEITEILNEILE